MPVAFLLSVIIITKSMNPNNPLPPSNFELPPLPVDGSSSNPETAARPETAPMPAQSMPMPSQQIATSPLPAQVALSQPSPTPEPVTTSAIPTLADDADLIEKEWVEKAKSIVAATRSDPRMQSSELNKFKADYLKKRYNKVIKLDES